MAIEQIGGRLSRKLLKNPEGILKSERHIKALVQTERIKMALKQNGSMP